jgi:signal transduction histidine kinase
MPEAGSSRRLLRVDPRVVDVVLAVSAVTVGQVEIWLGLSDGHDVTGATIVHHRPLSAVLFLVGLSMLALRRRAPVLGVAVMVSTFIAQAWALDPVAFFWGGFLPLVFMVYAVGAYTDGTRSAALGMAIANAGLLAVTLAVPSLRTWGDAAFNTSVLVVAWSVGLAAGAGGRRAEELASRADRLEREGERLIADERARLARELHDIVAHSVGVIAVQAEAGEALLDEPERAAAAFRSIQSTSRQALGELRRLLGLLREVDGLPTLAPQPGLSQIGELVEQVRAAGLDIDLAVHGGPREVDAGVDLSAYRVVQEALTNALKHAGTAHARVRVTYLPDAIQLEVSDNGRGATAVASGHGLVGMRERVALYGGEIFAGTLEEGGFTVRARLPLGSA